MRLSGVKGSMRAWQGLRGLTAFIRLDTPAGIRIRLASILLDLVGNTCSITRSLQDIN